MNSSYYIFLLHLPYYPGPSAKISTASMFPLAVIGLASIFRRWATRRPAASAPMQQRELPRRALRGSARCEESGARRSAVAATGSRGGLQWGEWGASSRIPGASARRISLISGRPFGCCWGRFQGLSSSSRLDSCRSSWAQISSARSGEGRPPVAPHCRVCLPSSPPAPEIVPRWPATAL